MGWQFRKSKGFGPVRFTLSKKGIGTSIGDKGFRMTKRVDGKIQRTISIPGTGIRHTSVISKEDSDTERYNYTPENYRNVSIIFRVVGILLSIIGLLLCLAVPLIGIMAVAAGIIFFYMGKQYREQKK